MTGQRVISRTGPWQDRGCPPPPRHYHDRTGDTPSLLWTDKQTDMYAGSKIPGYMQQLCTRNLSISNIVRLVLATAWIRKLLQTFIFMTWRCMPIENLDVSRSFLLPPAYEVRREVIFQFVCLSTGRGEGRRVPPPQDFFIQWIIPTVISNKNAYQHYVTPEVLLKDLSKILFPAKSHRFDYWYWYPLSWSWLGVPPSWSWSWLGVPLDLARTKVTPPPPPPDSTHHGLDTKRAVRLLRSRRRTFIVTFSFFRHILQLFKVMTDRSSEESDCLGVDTFCTALTGPYAIAMWRGGADVGGKSLMYS